MRILWHSNGPRDKTGYGRQTALFAPLLQAAGHEIAISAYHGHDGEPGEWQGIRVYPGGDDRSGMDVIAGHARHFRADLVITLMDHWAADPAGLDGLPAAHWLPIDTDRLAVGDRQHLQGSRGTPVAMTRHGATVLAAAGFEPLYVPHGICTETFSPVTEQGRRELRKLAGLDPAAWIVGINAANNDKHRKSYPQQFLAFARFQAKHPDAVLSVHARADNSAMDGLNLIALADACGLELGTDLVFCPQYEYRTGLLPDDAMANWYRCLNVLSLPSHGEGFGIPLIEAQACGVPVVTTRAEPMRELCGAGWLADAEPFWNWRHEAWWHSPTVGSLARCYEQAYRDNGGLWKRAREHALPYAAETVFSRYWEPALAALATTARPA